MFMFNGLTAEVSINGVVDSTSSFPTPNANQTPLSGGSAMAGVTTAGETLATPTATKTLYISSVAVQINGGAAGFELRDGGSGGTIKFTAVTPSTGDATVVLTFPTPLKFATDCYLKLSGSLNHKYGWTGWEE